jgi:iron(III) transport system ATP-binding protein
MRSGRILETGSPEKIYFHADHRFVADFIGRANLVDARVTRQEADRTVVDSAIGPMVCQKRDLAVGARATLCIRPEFIRLTTAGAGSGSNVKEAVVESLVFVGEAFEGEIRIDDQRLLAKIEPDSRVTEGGGIRVGMAPEHCLLLPAE